MQDDGKAMPTLQTSDEDKLFESQYTSWRINYCCPFCYDCYDTREEKERCMTRHGFEIIDISPKSPSNDPGGCLA